MTKVYLGQQVRVIQAKHKSELEGQVLYLDDVINNAHMGCYFVDGDPNNDNGTTKPNEDYGWVERIQAVEGEEIHRERYFDEKGFRKGFVRADVLPAELVPYDVSKDPEANGEAATAHDPVHHPSHYTGMPTGIECIDVIEWMNLCRGNAIKYIWRAGQKDPAKEVEDLEKAIWYLNREIDRLKRVLA